MGARTPSRRVLVVATRNRGKLEEFASMLADLPVELRAVWDVAPDSPEVVEDGVTFAENAIKKARAASLATGMLALADDSGLEVDALDGRPGVRSARFAEDIRMLERSESADANLERRMLERSESADANLGRRMLERSESADANLGRRMLERSAKDADNNAALLAALAGCGKPPPYPARFRCVLALIDPDSPGSEPSTAEGSCPGTIAPAPRGSGGFGYDPVFIVGGTDKTMAELGIDDKNRVSHRGRALAALRAHFPNKSTWALQPRTTAK